jgi:hypothetical protein
MYPNIFDSDSLMDDQNAAIIRQAYAASMYTGAFPSCLSTEKKAKEVYIYSTKCGKCNSLSSHVLDLHVFSLVLELAGFCP